MRKLSRKFLILPKTKKKNPEIMVILLTHPPKQLNRETHPAISQTT